MVRDSTDDNQSPNNTKRKNFNSCKNCFRRFDECTMKPIFIHKYDKELLKKKSAFRDILLQKSKLLENTHANEQFDNHQNGNIVGTGIFNTISNLAKIQS